MSVYICQDCHYLYDDDKEKIPFSQLPETWVCPVCGAPKSVFKLKSQPQPQLQPDAAADKEDDELEKWMSDIRKIADSGESIDEAMRTRRPVISWDDILFKGCQLARLPLLQEDVVSTRTVIGPAAKHPLVIESPVYVSHMSFGALSREAKEALAKGSAAAKTAMCSGEGGILEESISNAFKYIFEYVPNKYSVTDANLKRVDAIEIKIGQSAKPGMGGHLPAAKVTPDIAAVRGFPPGSDILSPAYFKDITSPAQLKDKVDELRERSDGKPIGVKIAAGNIEDDLDFIFAASPDFITVDGAPGGTGSSPKYIKFATGVPTLFATYRARKHFIKSGIKNVTLVITGGLRVSPDFAKALALGADAVAIATSALIAIGCRQYKVCNSGRCPMGITSQIPELRKRIDIADSARRLANFLRVSTDEIAQFARITGHRDVHQMSPDDLCTVNSEISAHSCIKHV